MKTTRKVTAILIALMVSSGLFTSCSPEAGSEKSNATTEIKDAIIQFEEESENRKMLKQYKTIDSSGTFTVGLKPDGSVWTWGANDSGQLGNGNIQQNYSGEYPPPGSTSPQMIISSDVVFIESGGGTAYAIKTDGSLWGWGSNLGNGKLGAGDDYITTPKKIIDSDVVAVSSDTFHTMVLKTDGSVWTWGLNFRSELGNGTNKPSTTPIKIIDRDAVFIETGSLCSFVIKSDGSLWAWGLNDNLQLGVENSGTSVEYREPVIVIDRDVIMVTSDGGYSAIVKRDGSLWLWGYNREGMKKVDMINLADKNIKQIVLQLSSQGYFPAKIPALFAIKTDGSLWGWETTDFRTGIINEYMIEKEGVLEISADGYVYHYKKADGSLWGAGKNFSGQVGDGTTAFRDSPVRVW